MIDTMKTVMWKHRYVRRCNTPIENFIQRTVKTPQGLFIPTSLSSRNTSTRRPTDHRINNRFDYTPILLNHNQQKMMLQSMQQQQNQGRILQKDLSTKTYNWRPRKRKETRISHPAVSRMTVCPC